MVCSGNIWETKLNFVSLVCCWIPMWCFVFLTGEYYIIWTWLNLNIQKATRLKSSCCKIHLLQGSRQTKSQHIKMKHIKHETQISTIKHKQTAKQSHVFITFLMISLNVSDSSRDSLKMAETSVLEKMFQSKIKSNRDRKGIVPLILINKWSRWALVLKRKTKQTKKRVHPVISWNLHCTGSC